MQNSPSSNDPDWLYAQLVKHLAPLAGTPLESFVLAELYAWTGYKRLDMFKAVGRREQQVEVFTELLRAAMSKDASCLPAKETAKVEITMTDVRPNEPDVMRRVDARDQDTIGATLLKLMTTPGIVVQVNAQITVIHPEAKLPKQSC